VVSPSHYERQHAREQEQEAAARLDHEEVDFDSGNGR
jgi:hypothetical protein